VSYPLSSDHTNPNLNKEEHKMTFTFSARGTYVNGNLIRTALTSREEQQHVGELLKKALGF
jgi:hypothetical protein